MPSSGNDLTGLLRAWSAGDPGAADQLIPVVYEELRRQASRYLARERSDHTLQPTALVNEAYLRLAQQRRVRLAGPRAVLCRRRHSDAAAAGGSRPAARRLEAGRLAARFRLDDGDVLALAPAPDIDVLALNDALTELAAVDPLRMRADRVAILRRAHHRGNRGGAWRVAGNGDAGMAARARVAARAADTATRPKHEGPNAGRGSRICSRP